MAIKLKPQERPRGVFMNENRTVYPDELKARLKIRFLNQWFRLGRQVDAAAHIHVPYETIIDWKKSDREFAEVCMVVKEALMDLLEDNLMTATKNINNKASVTAALGLLNAYRAQYFKRTAGSLEAGDSITNVQIIVDREPEQAKRLPATADAEISLDDL